MSHESSVFNPNHIKVGDRVIDFRNEKRGTVTWMGPNDRKCTVRIDGRDDDTTYFPRVWRRQEEQEDVAGK